MERFNVLTRAERQAAGAIELDQALAVLSSLDYNPCPIPSFFVVVSVGQWLLSGKYRETSPEIGPVVQSRA